MKDPATFTACYCVRFRLRIVNRARLPCFRGEDIKWLGGVFTNTHLQVVKVRVGTKAVSQGREFVGS